ncbi:MAG: protein kinase domain-containing protein [Candidatus Polarisedimenticolia bacterium]
MPLKTGSRLGPYEIIDSLGAGGMGEVYKARDTRLDRTVAVKVLPSHLSADPILRQRFEREARSVSQLNHPHICVLYDIGRDQDMDYLVMEHLEGETLAMKLQSGPLPTGMALNVAVQIADALDRAHRSGVVHRDLKPGNIMITRSGAKLLDFGLARQVASAVSPRSGDPASPLTGMPTALRSTPLTTEGAVVGTFQYMAPEQLEGGEADTRSDVFAFGVVLYEMLTGRRAFEGKNRASLVAAILRDEPRPLTEVSPTAPAALDHLLRACLAKDPEDRWQTMHDVMLQLRGIVEGQSAASAGRAAGLAEAGRPARGASLRRERVAWIAAAAGLATAVALWAGGLASRPAAAPVLKASIVPPEGIRYHLQTTQPGPPALSPDGRRIVFVGRDAHGKVSLHLRALESFTTTVLAGTDDASYPFWSPDGRSIGYFGRNGLYRIETGGGPPVKLCDVPAGKGGTWNRDGVILFTPSFNTPLHRTSAGGGASEPVTELDQASSENSHRSPHFLPDGEHFLFVARVSGVSPGEMSTIRLGKLGEKATRVVTRAGSQVSYAAGNLLFMRGSALMAQPFDAASLELKGDPVNLIDSVRMIQGAVRGIFDVSDTGLLAFMEGAEQTGMELGWHDLAGNQLSRIEEPADLFPMLDLSPDGRQATVVFTDPTTGTPDIWITDLARGSRTRFTLEPGAEASPVWSPDGSRIAFSADRKSAQFDLYTMEVSGRGEPQVILESDRTKFMSDWSPDGREIAFIQDDASRGDIWVTPFPTGTPRPLLQTRFDEGGARWSPDGRWMAYVSDESGRLEVYVMSYPDGGSRRQVSTEGGARPLWAKQGRMIAWLGQGGEILAADAVLEGGALTFGRPRRLFQHSDLEQFEIAADGERLLVMTNKEYSANETLSIVVNWPALLPH